MSQAVGVGLALLAYSLIWWGVKLGTHASDAAPLLYVATKLGADHYDELGGCGQLAPTGSRMPGTPGSAGSSNPAVHAPG